MQGTSGKVASAEGLSCSEMLVMIETGVVDLLNRWDNLEACKARVVELEQELEHGREMGTLQRGVIVEQANRRVLQGGGRRVLGLVAG